MAKIVPPPAKAADWDTIVTGTRQSAENTAKLAQQAKAGRFAMTTPLAQETAKIRSTVMQVAKKDGFQYCSAFPA